MAKISSGKWLHRYDPLCSERYSLWVNSDEILIWNEEVNSKFSQHSREPGIERHKKMSGKVWRDFIFPLIIGQTPYWITNQGQMGVGYRSTLLSIICYRKGCLNRMRWLGNSLCDIVWYKTSYSILKAVYYFPHN